MTLFIKDLRTIEDINILYFQLRSETEIISAGRMMKEDLYSFIDNVITSYQLDSLIIKSLIV